MFNFGVEQVQIQLNLMTNISTENQSTLTIHIEAISNKGEDKYLLVEYPTITIGVFDGLGGKSAGFGEETGGRIASREAARISEYILRNKAQNLTEDIVNLIKMEVCSYLKKEADNKIKLKFKGSLAQRLCTTLAIVNIHKRNPQEVSFNLNIAWIGDSRIYFLSPEKGLQQLTKDDLKMPNDAFKLIYEDSPMSKHLTADMHSDWEINFKIEQFQEKGCVIACTDGSFQCLDSPWDFERLLLDTLANSNNLSDWHNLLNKRYEQIKQDDVSLILYPIGISFDDFESIKNHYQKRLHILNENFSSDSTNYSDLVNLWNKYRLNYEERINLLTSNINNYDNKIELSDSYVQPIIDELPLANFSQEIQSDFTLDSIYILNEKKENYKNIEINEILLCPKCSSSKIIKNGFNNRREQKYKCKDCARNFQRSTRTDSVLGVYNSQDLPVFLLILIITVFLSMPIGLNLVAFIQGNN